MGYVTVKNIYPMENRNTARENTNVTKSFGNQGTVRLTLRGVEYVWGPNDSKTLPDPLGDQAVAASGGKLIVTNRS